MFTSSVHFGVDYFRCLYQSETKCEIFSTLSFYSQSNTKWYSEHKLPYFHSRQVSEILEDFKMGTENVRV